MMTEEDAGFKECRVGGSTMRDLETGRGIFPSCVGSACMHWRWESDAAWADRCDDEGAAAQEGAMVNRKKLEQRGYCGLAGNCV